MSAVLLHAIWCRVCHVLCLRSSGCFVFAVADLRPGLRSIRFVLSMHFCRPGHTKKGKYHHHHDHLHDIVVVAVVAQLRCREAAYFLCERCLDLKGRWSIGPSASICNCSGQQKVSLSIADASLAKWSLRGCRDALQRCKAVLGPPRCR